MAKPKAGLMSGEGGPVPPARVLHPLSFPVVGIDDHLPPVPPERLTAAALRARFANPPTWEAELRGDGMLFGDRAPSKASVLIGLVDRQEREGGLQVLLTQRTDHLRAHAGQISFPGGRAEDFDADVDATALREAHEEIGLDAERVEVLGRLPTYTTVTHFVVTPVVAVLRPPLELQLDAHEVADAFEVPLAFLMTPANHHRHARVYEGRPRPFLSMPWNERFIWGATASMLRNLYRFLSA
jgi:8-oxo-dGTP pyrophosphatase MutT (NUDIX family)